MRPPLKKQNDQHDDINPMLMFGQTGVHRHHHAVPQAIHDSNFGGVFSFWDRLFGTYHSSDAATRDQQPVGLGVQRAPADQRLDSTLLMPFRMAERSPN